MLAYIYIVILITLLLIIFSIVFWSLRNQISPMPSTTKTKNRMLEAIPKGTQGRILDLGSGWGTLVFAIANAFPHAQVIGYETSPIPYWTSRLRKFFGRQRNLNLLREDFFKADLSDADLIICYLYPAAMERLKDKFLKELPFGAVIISNTFAISSWKPIKTLEINDLYRSKIYIYQVASQRGQN